MPTHMLQMLLGVVAFPVRDLLDSEMSWFVQPSCGYSSFEQVINPAPLGYPESLFLHLCQYALHRGPGMHDCRAERGETIACRTLQITSPSISSADWHLHKTDAAKWHELLPRRYLKARPY